VILESVFLTMAGTAIGMCVGILSVLLLNFTGVNFEGLTLGSGQTWGVGGVGMIYPSLTAGDLFDGLWIASTMSLLSGIYPALRAVLMSPLRAIYNR
jgi:ABC-type lipoprotein release transport system permease subunit